MLEALSTAHNRARTLVLLAVCGLLAIGAAAVGVSDNPPGILLALLAAAAFVLAFVHPWRTARRFARLVYASVLGLVAGVVLHNVFEAIASSIGGSGVVHGLLVGANVTCFLIAILVCPPGVVVGAVGTVVMFIRDRRRPTAGPSTAG